MRKIFINGFKSKTGGGKSILSNYINLLKTTQTSDKYIVLVPCKSEYNEFITENISIIELSKVCNKNIFSPIINHFILPRLIKKHNIDLIFNLGDIIIPTYVPQLYLFDWPYAVYPDSIVWQKMDFQDYVNRKIKLFFFRIYLKYASVVIAQTETMKNKLESIYGLKNLVIIPNAVSLENMNGGDFFDFSLPKDKIKFLYLTHYYVHKNIEIFLILARKIKAASLPYCLVVTLEPSQHKNAKQFLASVETEGLNDIIINVGAVSMPHVPSLYSQIDALLMPTLLESFSGTYVEAMFHEKTILTSSFDFAKDVCGAAAFYFDPVNVDSIFDTIQIAFTNDELRNDKINEGNRLLTNLPNWPKVFSLYQELFKTLDSLNSPKPL